MADCIFCKIASGELTTEFIYQDDRAVAFPDLYPQAPVHALIIPRHHFNSIKEMDNSEMIGHLFSIGKIVAQKLGIESYRFVVNTGDEAGQTVSHLHVHLLGGRQMNWPPG